MDTNGFMLFRDVLRWILMVSTGTLFPVDLVISIQLKGINKGIESCTNSNVLIPASLQPLEISNYKFCLIIQSKFQIIKGLYHQVSQI